MVKKILLYTLAAFVLYNIFLYVARPATGTGQHQWQENRIKAEEYVYDHQGVRNVIVGSSLSFRMKDAFLPDSIYNLSFGGGSIYTGIDLILACEEKPRVLFIEVNIADRAGDPQMAEAIFRPVLYPLRKTVPALKEKYQPANLLAPLLKYAKKKRTEAPVASTADTAVYNIIIKRQIEEHQKLPDEKDLDQKIALLKEKMMRLKQQDVRVIFFTMPIAPQLADVPKLKYVREQMRLHFPEGDYTWMPDVSGQGFTFTDGLHMDYSSASRFTALFLKQAATYLQ